MKQKVVIELDLSDYGDIDHNLKSFMDDLLNRHYITIKSYEILSTYCIHCKSEIEQYSECESCRSLNT